MIHDFKYYIDQPDKSKAEIDNQINKIDRGQGTITYLVNKGKGTKCIILGQKSRLNETINKKNTNKVFDRMEKMIHMVDQIDYNKETNRETCMTSIKIDVSPCQNYTFEKLFYWLHTQESLENLSKRIKLKRDLCHLKENSFGKFGYFVKEQTGDNFLFLTVDTNKFSIEQIDSAETYTVALKYSNDLCKYKDPVSGSWITYPCLNFTHTIIKVD